MYTKGKTRDSRRRVQRCFRILVKNASWWPLNRHAAALKIKELYSSLNKIRTSWLDFRSGGGGEEKKQKQTAQTL